MKLRICGIKYGWAVLCFSGTLQRRRRRLWCALNQSKLDNDTSDMVSHKARGQFGDCTAYDVQKKSSSSFVMSRFWTEAFRKYIQENTQLLINAHKNHIVDHIKRHWVPMQMFLSQITLDKNVSDGSSCKVRAGASFIHSYLAAARQTEDVHHSGAGVEDHRCSGEIKGSGGMFLSSLQVSA